MKSVYDIRDDDLAENVYDMPGCRFWLQRTPGGYKVYGFRYLGFFEYFSEYRELSRIFASFLLDVPGAEGMKGGARLVLAKCLRDAS